MTLARKGMINSKGGVDRLRQLYFEPGGWERKRTHNFSEAGVIVKSRPRHLRRGGAPGYQKER